MAYKVIIAEKPSVAKEIAHCVGAHERHAEGPCGYIEGNGYRVTWAFGHLVGLQTPEEMGYKSGALPMMPEEWPTKILGRRNKEGKEEVDPLVKKQMKTIETLFSGCSEIIVATDAGREGELIFRYIYEYLNCKKPFSRLWISSLTDEAIREGMKNILPGDNYEGLNAAAHLRSQSDWLVGYNASKALRIATGYRGMLSLGRVQTPTLGLICERYIQFKNFKPTPFWKLKVTGTKADKSGYVNAVSEKNYPDEASAKADAVKVSASGILNVTNIEKKRAVSKPPLLFDLTSLQRAANARYGLTADETLKAAQSLYEKKYLTYPRTGSCYIPDDVFKTIPSLIKKVSSYGLFTKAANELDGVKLCRKSVDASKVTDHHALLPTDIIPGELSGNEKKVWELVAGRLLEAFGEDSLSDVTTVTLDGNGVIFKARGSVLVKAGWKGVWGAEEKKEKTGKKKDGEEGDDDQDDAGIIPPLTEGERLAAGAVEVDRRTDKPQPIHTDNSLLKEMETCGKNIDDEQAREAMKDVGLGTPATRAATIEGLIIRKYIGRDGKKIIPTPLGLQVWDMVKGRDVADVKTTGEWERDLALVEHGQMNPKVFDRQIRAHTEELVNDLMKNCRPLEATADSFEAKHTCPVCGKEMKNMKFSISCLAENGGCGLKIPREVAGKKLPESAITALCQGKKTATIKGFTAKSGKKFDACLWVDKEKKAVQFAFDNGPSGPSVQGKKCPNCGETLKDERGALRCDCGFTFWKTICGKPFSEAQIETLLQGKPVSMSGLKSKSGKTFQAKVSLDRKTGKTTMEFENNKK